MFVGAASARGAAAARGSRTILELETLRTLPVRKLKLTPRLRFRFGLANALLDTDLELLHIRGVENLAETGEVVKVEESASIAIIPTG